MGYVEMAGVILALIEVCIETGNGAVRVCPGLLI